MRFIAVKTREKGRIWEPECKHGCHSNGITHNGRFLLPERDPSMGELGKTSAQPVFATVATFFVPKVSIKGDVAWICVAQGVYRPLLLAQAMPLLTNEYIHIRN